METLTLQLKKKFIQCLNFGWFFAEGVTGPLFFDMSDSECYLNLTGNTVWSELVSSLPGFGFLPKAAKMASLLHAH